MASRFITVSIEIMHDKNLTLTQKFILAEIEQLSSLEDGCYAKNIHFSELIGITKTTASKAISSLEEMGYISIEIEAGSRNHTRVISLVKMTNPPCQNDKPPLSKGQETKENRHSIRQFNIQKGVSEKAFEMWIKYKGASYTQQGATLSMNKLSQFEEDIQIEMVETAIMNGWKGLFEIKKYSPAKTTSETIDDFFDNQPLDAEVI